MSTPPVTMDLCWMQSLNGYHEILTPGIPVAEALGALEAAQAEARRGELGFGVFVFLRPSEAQSVGSQPVGSPPATDEPARIVLELRIESPSPAPMDVARAIRDELTKIMLANGGTGLL